LAELRRKTRRMPMAKQTPAPPAADDRQVPIFDVLAQ